MLGSTEGISERPDPAVRRRQSTVMVGLLLSFVGFVLVSLLLPVDSGALDRALPVLTAGIACLWVGGILLGIGSPARRRR